MLLATPPHAHIIRLAVDAHAASIVERVPELSLTTGLVVVISSPHDLRRGPVKYEGGYRRQKLAAAAFPFNSRHDFFAAGLALNAGGGRGCAVHAGNDVCRTVLGRGFFRLRHEHWKKLKITVFKPARQAARISVVLRPAAGGA